MTFNIKLSIKIDNLLSPSLNVLNIRAATQEVTQFSLVELLYT